MAIEPFYTNIDNRTKKLTVICDVASIPNKHSVAFKFSKNAKRILFNQAT